MILIITMISIYLKFKSLISFLWFWEFLDNFVKSIRHFFNYFDFLKFWIYLLLSSIFDSKHNDHCNNFDLWMFEAHIMLYSYILSDVIAAGTLLDLFREFSMVLWKACKRSVRSGLADPATRQVDTQCHIVPMLSALTNT